MSLPAMRFKNFLWPKNPAKLHIASQRQIHEVFLPFFHSSFQDFGPKRRVISGEGLFLGPSAGDTFQELSDLLAKGGSGTLCLPALPPITAALVKLDLIADPAPNTVRYSFEFWEDPVLGTASQNGELAACPVPAGDNVWSAAVRCGSSYDKILSQNPHIQWPNFFPHDDWLVIP